MPDATTAIGHPDSRPHNQPNHLVSPAGSLKGTYNESQLQPLPSCPYGVLTAVTNNQDTTLNKNDLYNMVGLSGSGLGQ